MLENAWREEFQREKLRETRLREERLEKEKLERLESENSSDYTNSRMGYQWKKCELNKLMNTEESSSDLEPKASFSQSHSKNSKSLDSSDNRPFKFHALHHITRIVPPTPLSITTSNLNPGFRFGHRATNSLPQNQFTNSNETQHILSLRNESNESEPGMKRGRSRETVSLAAFDHTLLSSRRPSYGLKEPSFLALPASIPQTEPGYYPTYQSSFESLVENKHLKLSFGWNSSLSPPAKLWNKMSNKRNKSKSNESSQPKEVEENDLERIFSRRSNGMDLNRQTGDHLLLGLNPVEPFKLDL